MILGLSPSNSSMILGLSPTSMSCVLLEYFVFLTHVHVAASSEILYVHSPVVGQ